MHTCPCARSLSASVIRVTDDGRPPDVTGTPGSHLRSGTPALSDHELASPSLHEAEHLP